MKDKDTPLALVRLWSKIAKDCYRQLDNCRAAKSDGSITWPDYCLLPINAAATYLVYGLGQSEQDAAAGSAELTACWMWRQNKIIYAFDRDLTDALAEQAEDVKDTDILPADLLMHLPYPCIYIKAPGLLEHVDGFWAWVDYDTNRLGPELRIQWVFETMDASVPQVLHIIPGATIGACILDTMQTTLEHTREPVDLSRPADSSRIILSAIQLLLYILADNADVEDEPPQRRTENRKPAGINTKKSIQDKAGEITAKNVGVRVGAAFRRSRSHRSTNSSTGTGSAKRPHMRRGHWHHYWRGPMTGERELVLHWTAPMMIHGEIGADDDVIVYPVKD